MKNYSKGFLYAISAQVVAAVFIAGPAFAADSKKIAVGVGIEYATGDYGTDITTDSWRVPLTIDYLPTNRVSFEFIIPYLYQSNSNTILAGGMRFPFQMQGGMRRTTTINTSDSVSGLGDSSLTTQFLLLKESETRPSVIPLVYLKFPTGDEDKALGTGEFDIGGGIGIIKWFGPMFTFAEGRYIFQGSNADLGLKDYGTLEGEIGYRMSEKFFPSVSVWWSSSPADEADDLMEARLKGAYKIDDTVHLEGYLGTGLTDSSADFGAGLALFFHF